MKQAETRKFLDTGSTLKMTHVAIKVRAIFWSQGDVAYFVIHEL